MHLERHLSMVTSENVCVTQRKAKPTKHRTSNIYDAYVHWAPRFAWIWEMSGKDHYWVRSQLGRTQGGFGVNPTWVWYVTKTFFTYAI